MKILKDPTDYAAELVTIFGNNETALAAFNEARNGDDGWLPAMPQEWCIEVARSLGVKFDD
jgi:hypothetical protein